MREEVHQILIFKVIVSNDKQYSLWLIDREIPPGWYDAGQMQGSAKECLAHIREWYFRDREDSSASDPSSRRRGASGASAAWA